VVSRNHQLNAMVGTSLVYIILYHDLWIIYIDCMQQIEMRHGWILIVFKDVVHKVWPWDPWDLVG